MEDGLGMDPDNHAVVSSFRIRTVVDVLVRGGERQGLELDLAWVNLHTLPFLIIFNGSMKKSRPSGIVCVALGAMHSRQVHFMSDPAPL